MHPSWRFGGALLVGLAVGACGPAGPPPLAPLPAMARTESKEAMGVQVLELSIEYVFDAAGNYTKTFKRRYRVLSSEGISGWGEFEAEWQPWFMAKPEVAVHVVDAGGRDHPLDPATLIDAPAEPSSSGVLSDARALRAPLPAIEIGSVVEEKTVWRTTRPFSVAGAVYRFPFGAPFALDAARMVVDVPEGFPLRHRVLDARVQVHEERAGGRHRLVVTGGPYPAMEPLEPFQPPEVATWPSVAFSTGEGWSKGARTYEETVAKSLGDPGIAAVLRDVVSEADSPSVKAQKILAWVRTRVRYADVEFGAASFEPAKPSDTLRRGYGDCKDQSALLVSLLRASGIDAHVALLLTGPGEDIREDLPGLNAFDHAIVVANGPTPPIWMDPTASFHPAGVLPSGEQGRLALVIGPGTEGLVRTPSSDASANFYREEREIVLSDFGPGRVVETTTGTGDVEANVRAGFAGARDAVQSSLDRYVKETYYTDRPAKIDMTAARDLTQPFRVRVEAVEARAANTDLTDAAAAIDVRSLLAPLPPALKGSEPRKTPAFLPLPFHSEIRYRIVPPAGFIPAELPRPDPIAFGPAKLERAFSAANDGAVTASFRFELGKTRLDAREAQALQEGVRKLGEESDLTLRFDHKGSRLIAEGRVREGMEVYRGLLGPTPDKAVQHARFASALLASGFGHAARLAARKAVELAPDVPALQRELGFVLLHDGVGRQLTRGWDRDGAIAAYKKALSLDPKDSLAKVNIALALERDADGRPSAVRADLEQAILQYDAVDAAEITHIGGTDYSNNAIQLLLRLERFDEVVQRLRKRPPARAAANMLGAAVAGLRGAPAAIDEVTRLGLDGEARAQSLAAAADQMVRLRRYPEAAALLEAAAQSGSEAAAYRSRATLLRQVRRHEAMGLSDKTPEDFVRGAFVGLYLGQPPGAASPKSLFASARLETLSQAEVEKSLAEMREGFAQGLSTTQVSPEVGIDSALAVVKLKHQPKHGVAEVVEIEYGGRAATTRVVVVREGAGHRLVAIDDLGEAACLGALQAVRRHQDAVARHWLDWGRELAGDPRPDPLESPPISQAWTRGSSADVAAATGCLCATETASQKAIELLLEARPRVTDAGLRQAVDHALALAWMRGGDGAKTLEAADRLAATSPGSDAVFWLRAGGLSMARRADELRALVRARVAKSPNDVGWLERLANAEEQVGNFDEARRIWQKILDSGKATAGAYNNCAWMSMFHKGARDADVDLALHAVQMSSYGDLAALHTLAMLYAEVGRHNEAWQTLKMLIDKRPGKIPDAIDHVVIGRIAEHYGLEDAARESYERVPKPTTDSRTSTWQLAQKKLAALGKPAPKR